MKTALKSLNSYLIYSLVLLFTAVLFGCSDDDDDDAPPSPTPAIIDFGANYAVLEGATGPTGIEIPVLAGDSLWVRVGFSGCSADHEFELRSRLLSANRAEVWLYKITEDEDCAAYFAPDEFHRIPFDVLARNEIFLVGPGFYSYQLR